MLKRKESLIDDYLSDDIDNESETKNNLGSEGISQASPFKNSPSVLNMLKEPSSQSRISKLQLTRNNESTRQLIN